MRKRAPRLQPGEKVVDHVTVVGAVDDGGRDPVYIVWHHDAWCAMCCKLFLKPSQARWEARALARSAHPGIVRLLEDGSPRYLLTEFLEGPSLRRLIRSRPKGRLSAADALRVAVHLGSALAHLHGRGYLHLDVKPANVIVTRRRPVLFDLGSARRADGRKLGSPQGTDAYMAPEQCRAGVPSPASDVYGLGVTLFEMLTGARPFPEGDGAESDRSARGRFPLDEAGRRRSGRGSVEPLRVLDPVEQQVHGDPRDGAEAQVDRGEPGLAALGPEPVVAGQDGDVAGHGPAGAGDRAHRTDGEGVHPSSDPVDVRPGGEGVAHRRFPRRLAPGLGGRDGLDVPPGVGGQLAPDLAGRPERLPVLVPDQEEHLAAAAVTQVPEHEPRGLLDVQVDDEILLGRVRCAADRDERDPLGPQPIDHRVAGAGFDDEDTVERHLGQRTEPVGGHRGHQREDIALLEAALGGRCRDLHEEAQVGGPTGDRRVHGRGDRDDVRPAAAQRLRSGARPVPDARRRGPDPLAGLRIDPAAATEPVRDRRAGDPRFRGDVGDGRSLGSGPSAGHVPTLLATAARPEVVRSGRYGRSDARFPADLGTRHRCPRTRPRAVIVDVTVLDRARPSARSPASLRTALRSGRLRRLLAGHIAGKLGLHLLVLGVGLHVLQQTSSGTWTSVVVALGYAPQALLSGYAGAIADRHARGTVLAWSSSIRGCCGVLAVLAAVQNWPPAVLVAAVAVASVAATPAYPAVAAAAPGCVREDSLPAANTLVSGVENAGWTAGPGLFGGILLVGGGPLSALAAATVLHGIGTLTACRLTLPAPDAGPGPVRSGDLLAATRLVLRAPGLRGPMQLATIGNFLYGYLVVVLVLLGSSTDPEAAGRLNAGLAVGAVASLLVVHRLAGRADATRVPRWSLVAFGMCVLLVGMVRAADAGGAAGRRRGGGHVDRRDRRGHAAAAHRSARGARPGHRHLRPAGRGGDRIGFAGRRSARRLARPGPRHGPHRRRVPGAHRRDPVPTADAGHP